jgi:hypothetical protein
MSTTTGSPQNHPHLPLFCRLSQGTIVPRCLCQLASRRVWPLEALVETGGLESEGEHKGEIKVFLPFCLMRQLVTVSPTWPQVSTFVRYIS